MKYEFHAQYPLFLQDTVTQEPAINYLTDYQQQPPKGWPALRSVADHGARLNLLAQALASPHKDYARVGRGQRARGLRYWYGQGRFQEFLDQQQERYLRSLRLLPSIPDVTSFPTGSWAIRFTFTLQKPYISTDDLAFYIADNPIKKDWVFKLPYVAPSQWKGALRAAMVQQLVSNKDKLSDSDFANERFALTLLFGDEKGEDKGSLKSLAEYLDNVKEAPAQDYRKKVRGYFGIKEDKPLPHHAGRLHFYPSYFTRIGLEVINPHERPTGVGKNPIYTECIPKGSQGTFILLYVPMDRVGEGEDETLRLAKADVRRVTEGIGAMLTEYGFGAKTSSGFGVAENDIEGGVMVCNWLDKPEEKRKSLDEPVESKVVPTSQLYVVKCSFRTLDEMVNVAQQLGEAEDD